MYINDRRTSRVRTQPSVCSEGIVRCRRSSHGRAVTSLFVHQLVLSPLGGVASPWDELRQREKSRNGLTERPRWAREDARLRERKSDAGVEAGMGLEATRAIWSGFAGAMDGPRMVDTDPPRGRTVCADCEAGVTYLALGDASPEGRGDVLCGGDADGLRGEDTFTLVESEEEWEEIGGAGGKGVDPGERGGDPWEAMGVPLREGFALDDMATVFWKAEAGAQGRWQKAMWDEFDEEGTGGGLYGV